MTNNFKSNLIQYSSLQTQLQRQWAEIRDVLLELESTATAFRLDFGILLDGHSWSVAEIEELFVEAIPHISSQTLVRFESSELLDDAPLDTSLEYAELILRNSKLLALSRGSLLSLPNKFVLRADVLNEAAWQLQHHISHYHELPQTKVQAVLSNSLWTGIWPELGDVSVKLLNSPSEFALYLITQGYDGEHEFPFFEELNVSVEFAGKFNEEAAWALLAAYLRELERSCGIHITPRPPRSLPSFVGCTPLVFAANDSEQISLKPGYVQPESRAIVGLFNKANVLAAEGYLELAFLQYFKTIEYAAASAARLRVHQHLSTVGADNIRKLKSVASDMDSDAKRIAEVLAKACDERKLKALCPVRGKGLVEVLTSTRNQYSHAKPGYATNGSEILEADLQAGTAFVKEAAAQVLDWFLGLPAGDKVVG